MATQESSIAPTILLVDNGSTRVDAAVQLRALAKKLSLQTGQKIHPVSMQHSDRIPTEDVNSKLDGLPALVFREFMTEQLNISQERKGQRNFILIPLFFGNSRALTSFVPNELELLEAQFGAIQLNMTEVLYPLPNGESKLVEILYEHAISAANGDSKEALKNLVLVDHGSPLPAVNAVRQHIADALNAKLPKGISLNQAAMERRQGKEYDFNGELLADYLSRLAAAGETQATVLLLFLLAGTHAGENGDIVQICNAVMREYPDFKVSISPLISQHEKLVECLAQRLNQVLT